MVEKTGTAISSAACGVSAENNFFKTEKNVIRATKTMTKWEHAVAVQKRRHDAGKRGYAKAVRRYLKRTFGGIGEYQRMRARLDVRWDRAPVPVVEEGEAA